MDSLYTYESPSISGHSPMINYRKDAKKGVKFTFMVVGELGTGKTTFINSLLNKKVVNHRFERDELAIGETKTLTFTSAKSVALPSTSILTRNDFNPSTSNEEPGIALTETKIEMVDDDQMKLLLNIIDTPGFGENLNNEICFVEIENYLKQQFDLVLAEETRIKRNPRFVDTRVHVLLYFITATGHGLRELDINCMKRLSKYVNIIPVISKADSFTEKELANFKRQIKIDIEKFNVPIFQFDSYLNEYDEQDDHELIEECKFLSKLQPFAIISSEDDYEIKDTHTGEVKTIKARNYPWGLVDINNPKYSDFPILKSVILGSHLQDLKDLTHDFLYETYRTERLTKVTGKVGHQNGEDEYDEGEFHDTVESHQSNFNKDQTTVPSLSNLAQLANTSNQNGHNHNNTTIDNESVDSASSSIKKSKSMLLDEDEQNNEMPSPNLGNNLSFHSSNSTLSFDNNSNTSHNGVPPRNLNPQNAAFKRLSIAPQRNQLRQISETVPYVIRHERILERQQKLEELEMASAKELANRAAALEQKAAALKAREKSLMAKREVESRKASAAASPESNKISNGESKIDEVNADEEVPLESNESIHSSMIKKDETLTDLNSVVENKE